MAPMKKEGEKEIKLTPQEAAKAIIDYLRKTNRPYSPTEVSGNLKIGLALAKKLLKDMHERQEIACCASGKQQVYHVIQDEIPPDHQESITAVTTEIARLKEECSAFRSEEKELRTSLRECGVRVPLPQLKADVAGKELEKTQLELRLKSLRDGNMKPVDVVERDRITKRYSEVKKVAAQRKKIREKVWAIFMDAQENGNAEELKEQLGLEF